jgi:hypothetical protein
MTARSNPQTVPLTTSFHQRSLTIVASVLITLTLLAGNLQIARGYADGAHTPNQTAQAAQPVRLCSPV